MKSTQMTNRSTKKSFLSCIAGFLTGGSKRLAPIPYGFQRMPLHIEALESRIVPTAFSFTEIANQTTLIPDGVGEFDSFGAPQLDDGDVYFKGTSFDGSRQEGIYQFDGASLTALVDLNDPAPGGNGTFLDIRQFFVNSGFLVFSAFTQSASGTIQEGLYRRDQSGTLSVVADEGTAVPDGTGNFDDFGIDPEISSNGDVVFVGRSANPNQGLYLSAADTGQLSRLVDSTASFPGSAEGTLFSFEDPTLENGQVAFIASKLLGESDEPDRGIFLVDVSTSEITTVANDQTTIPDTSDQLKFFRELSSLDDGRLAYYGTTTVGGSDVEAIHLIDGGNFQTIANENTPAPGAVEPFSAFGNPHLSDGEVAFQGETGGDSEQSGDGAIFITVDGTLRRIIGEGDSLPGIFGPNVQSMGLGDFENGATALSLFFDDGSQAIYHTTTSAVWNAAVSGAFSDDSNWRNNQTPGENDSALVNEPGAPYTISLTSDTSLQQLQVGGNGTEVVLNHSDFSLDAQRLIIANSPSDLVDFSVDDDGVIVVSSILSSSFAFGPAAFAGPAVTAAEPGPPINIDQFLILGEDGGKGTFRIQGDTQARFNQAFIGVDENAAGTFIVSGDLAEVTVAQDVHVGIDADATLRIEDGAEFLIEELGLVIGGGRIIGRPILGGAAGNGNVTVTGEGSKLQAPAGLLAIANQFTGSVGQLNVVDGAEAEFRIGWIAQSAGPLSEVPAPGSNNSAGSILVNGGLLKFTESLAETVDNFEPVFDVLQGVGLVVGGEGNVTLDGSTAPSTIESRTVVIGLGDGPAGTANVTGSQANWLADNIFVSPKFEFPGVLQINQGAAMESEFLHLSGQSQLFVATGGKLRTNTAATIGLPFDAIGGLITPPQNVTATAAVSGTGSTWDVAQLFVGGGNDHPQGTGILQIDNNGKVISNNVVALKGGQIIGNGTLQSPVKLEDGGTIAPGLSPGILEIDGDLIVDPGGVIEIEIAGPTPGTEYDQLIVTGDVTLGGTLKLIFLDGYVPRSGDRFDFLVGDVNGQFEDVIIEGLPPGVETSFDLSVGSVTITSTPGIVVVGADAGGQPSVVVFDSVTGTETMRFLAYDAAFLGGVSVATGDVDGDGVTDVITAPGSGGGPHIRAFDGATGILLRDFMAYNVAFTGGVQVAAGDVNDDGIADVITGAGPGGGPHVKVFDGATGQVLADFMAFDINFGGGISVAAGDVNNDGFSDLIVGMLTGGSHVRVYSGADGSLLRDFSAFDAAFGGGVFLAAGDFNGDGLADIVVGAGLGGGPHVKVFSGLDGETELSSFFAFDTGFAGGVRVAVGDANGDGILDLIAGAGPGGGPHVKYFHSGPPIDTLADFFAFDPGFTGGVLVA